MMTILFALVALLSLLAGTADACLKYRATWNKAKDEFDVALIDDNFTVCEANNWRIGKFYPLVIGPRNQFTHASGKNHTHRPTHTRPYFPT
jgi:hypothetical protein